MNQTYNVQNLWALQTKIAKNRYLSHYPLLLLLIAYGGYSFSLIRPLPIIQMVDYWNFLNWGRGISFANPQGMIHDFYPIGYPYLIKLAWMFEWDVARYGQIVSFVGAVLGGGAVYSMIYRLTERPWAATAVSAILAFHPMYAYMGVREGTDMLGAGLLILAIALIWHTTYSSSKMMPAAAGVVLGLAYLIRYTSLAILPLGILFLLWDFYFAEKKRKWDLVLFVACFFIVTLPQTVPSWEVTGNPFYNAQARNIWFGLYGNFDWAHNWGRMPQGITLSQIIRDDPVYFVTHWATEFSRLFIFENGQGLSRIGIERHVTFWRLWPLHLLGIVSSVAVLFDKRLTFGHKIFLIGALYGPPLATSMAWLYFRFLLATLAIQVVVIGFFLTYLSRLLPLSLRRVFVGVVGVLFCANLFLATPWHERIELSLEVKELNGQVNQLVEAAGIQNVSRVFSNNRLHQSVENFMHIRFGRLVEFDQNFDLETEQFLEAITRGNRDGFLIFDWTVHGARGINYRAYHDVLLADKERLVLLYDSEEHTLYCQRPCLPNNLNRLRADRMVTEGLWLDSYMAHTSFDGAAQGIYLFWRADQPQAQDFQFQLRLVDAKGDVVYEHIGEPQLNTYPTSQWVTGEEIADFYLIDLGNGREGDVYTLELSIVGEEETGAVTIPLEFAVPQA